MATGPSKSPLHNFPLPLLKWASKNSVNSPQRFRRSTESSPPPSTEKSERNDNRHRCSLSSDRGDYDGVSKGAEAESDNRKLTLGSRSGRNRISFVDITQRQQQQATPQIEKERLNESFYDGDDEHRARVVVAVRDSDVAEVGAAEAEPQGDESAHKPWNLRPRRAAIKPPIEIGGGASKNGDFHEQMENLPKSMRLRGFAESSTAESRENRRFWIALSREEIEEDIYALSGSKPARRPRKRARTVQKQLDNVFPCLWLVGLSPETYRGLDAPAKR
ncbi:hypothetical protein Nepgr_031688 [Nepenthes gracilis]|uniref:Uncharacterized protein n=1 Tax=Nepenthes gracilis TaxID=150966 RepID=A0AAD3THU7_NEPGR|nr:hypothetical protein Nepgr_031688 [Nepenthes gracilis]